MVLLDGSGREGLGRIARIGKRRLEVAIETVRYASPPEGPPVTLYVAGLRIERLAWIAEKATELGAVHLGIVRTARAQSFRVAAPLARLERIVREAAKQSALSCWPQVSGALSLEEALAAPAAQRLLLDRGGVPFPSRLERRPLALLVGPEGGWVPEEVARARERGWSRVALPAGQLRAETAAIAGLVLAQAALAREA